MVVTRCEHVPSSLGSAASVCSCQIFPRRTLRESRENNFCVGVHDVLEKHDLSGNDSSVKLFSVFSVRCLHCGVLSIAAHNPLLIHHRHLLQPLQCPSARSCRFFCQIGNGRDLADDPVLNRKDQFFIRRCCAKEAVVERAHTSTYCRRAFSPRSSACQICGGICSHH